MSCEHTPMLVIYKGEDSTFNGNKRPVITLISPHEIEGYTATFDFFNLHQEFSAEQVAKKKLPLTYTAEQTKTLPFGMNYATLTFKSPGKLTETVKLVIGVTNRNYVIVEGMGVAIDGAYETDAEILSKTDVTPRDYTNGSIAEATLKMWKKLGGTVASILVAACAFAELPPGVAYNKDLKADTPVVTNVDVAASSKRDLTDLAVYRRVKDCWTWTNWDGAKDIEPLAREAPADFLELANSPGSKPIHFERVAGAWYGAVQFWPNGKVKYSQAEIPPGGTGEFSTQVNFAMYAYDETGTNKIYRFGATATRTDPTNETVVAWDGIRNEYIRIATTDLVHSQASNFAFSVGASVASSATNYTDAVAAGLRETIDGIADYTGVLERQKRNKRDLSVGWTWTTDDPNCPPSLVTVLNRADSPTPNLIMKGATGEWGLGEVTTNGVFGWINFTLTKSPDANELRFGFTDERDGLTPKYFATAHRTTSLAKLSDVALATNGIRRIDGEARMLPPYLHVLSFDDGYPEDAAWYFDHIDHIGYCSSARRGDTYVRNYDWRYDESATFVIRMSAASNRFASVGISNVGTNLTESIVTSGALSRYYRCLPGHTLDGINEKGLVCNINVVTTNGSPWESHVDGDGRTLNILGACRYLLDNYACASNAAAYVAAHAYVPVSMQKLGDSIHLMVADAKETWIVEDGVAHLLTPAVGAYMTNFRRFNPDDTTPAVDPYGAGFERAALLADPSRPLLDGLTNAWYTHAYRRLPDDSFPWPTEFAGMVDEDGAIPNTETNRLQAWAKANVPDVPLQRGWGWWQTVHSSRYDIPSRTMRVAVQERDDWYLFSLDGLVTPLSVRETSASVSSNVVDELVADWAKKPNPAPTFDLTPALDYTTAVSNKLETAVTNAATCATNYTDSVSETLSGLISAEETRAKGVEDLIIEEINAFKAFDIRVLDTLPDSGEAGVVYLVKAADYETTKTRDEYLWSNDAWRLIGSTRFDSDKIAKTLDSTPIPPNLTNLVSYINYKEHDGVTIPEDEDGSVVIGKKASGTVSPSYIASLTNKTTRTTLRSASVAIGMNADATGGKDSGTAQSIAIGWNSKAKASNAIAIGSGAVHWFEDDETGPAAVAAGSESIALGYEAKAKASGSMQIGRGRNEEPNSLKFWDTYIVKDGKVQGSLDTNAVKTLVSENLDPTLVQDLTDELTVKSHALTTYSPTNGVPEELAVTPTGTRNYEIYVPNTAEMRASLPMQFMTEIEGDVTKLGPWWNKKVVRLPAKITMKEPLPKTLILEVEEYETDWDWTPVVVNATCSNATVNVVGTNLHWMVSATIGGTNYPITNPLYGQLHFAADVPAGTEGQLKDAEGVSRVTFTVE